VQTIVQVLSEDEITRVHESTLKVLADTGVRVETALGRKYLAEAGAKVDENTKIVRFPRRLVEESLKQAPKDFTLGARRPGWDLKMNSGNCVLCADGEGITFYDWKTGEFRPSTFDDWLHVTRLIDSIDEVGVYWSMVERGMGETSRPDLLNYWRHLFGNFSKHVNDGISHKDQAPWLVEVLQVIFGEKETIRDTHPLSCLLCPQSPLVIDEQYTDAYLALHGYNIPLAVMPMPLMGGTGPGNMISMVILGNCEILAMLCLLQAAEPGTPFLYAPALAIMNPRSGLLASGAVENGLLGAAAVQMARYYGLPVIGTGGGTDHFIPGIQASYERAINALLPILTWPDIFIGPGLLGGSMVLCPEQVLIDAEIFRMSKHTYRGISTNDEKWLDEVISKVGPAGHFMADPSTRDSLRNGEWHISRIGMHGTLQEWEAAGKPALLDELREQVQQIIKNHDPLPLGEDVEKELERIEKRMLEETIPR